MLSILQIIKLNFKTDYQGRVRLEDLLRLPEQSLILMIHMQVTFTFYNNSHLLPIFLFLS